MNESDKRRIGKFISLALRHDPKMIGLAMDEHGWVEVADLISKSAKRNVVFSKKDLDEIVSTNDKKRYAYNDDETKIRANQGHSIQVDLQFVEKKPPMFLYHGTAERFVSEIKEGGIQKMSRQYVHLSEDKDTAIKLGSRRGKPYIFIVLAQQMFNEGCVFYQSENGVWLTDFVALKYLSK